MHMISSGRMLRMLRLRREWRQQDVAGRAGLSRAAVGRHENGIIGSVDAVERHASVFGLRLELRLVGRGGQLLWLADEEHAAIVERLARWLSDEGWMVEPEASFSEWGERGRIDLLAHEPRAGTLAIVEVKTALLDLQDLFGRLDVKKRLAGAVARRRGWTVRRRVVLLAVADTHGNRATVAGHRSSFASFAPRRLTRSAFEGSSARVLTWIPARQASRRAWLAGRQRVRRRIGSSLAG